MVGQDHLDGVLPDGRGQVIERDHAHIGGERHRGVPRDLRHPVDAGRRVFQVLEHPG
jgi:hypothetical protein